MTPFAVPQTRNLLNLHARRAALRDDSGGGAFRPPRLISAWIESSSVAVPSRRLHRPRGGVPVGRRRPLLLSPHRLDVDLHGIAGLLRLFHFLLLLLRHRRGLRDDIVPREGHTQGASHGNHVGEERRQPPVLRYRRRDLVVLDVDLPAWRGSRVPLRGSLVVLRARNDRHGGARPVWGTLRHPRDERLQEELCGAGDGKQGVRVGSRRSDL
mmetsp:Transcript_5452/g.19690  ORF Transcript_5452/g.19690 Transcript_5452/m.19690 type:complete len:212 (-) Transcript_5452:459-1094(-)